MQASTTHPPPPPLPAGLRLNTEDQVQLPRSLLFKSSKTAGGNESLVPLLAEHFDLEKEMYPLFVDQPLLIEDELEIFATKHKIPGTLEEIDHLAVDGDGNVVVIEVKKDLAKNVLEQGLSYVHWVTKNLSQVQLLANEFFSNKSKEFVDYPNLEKSPKLSEGIVRLIIVAPEISDKLARAAEFSTAPVDLIEVNRYTHGDEAYYHTEYILKQYKRDIQAPKEKPFGTTLFKGKVAAIKPVYGWLLEKAISEFQPNGDFTYEEKTKSLYIAFYRQGSRFLILTPHQDRIRVLARLADKDLDQFQPHFEAPIKWETKAFTGFNAAFNVSDKNDVEKYFQMINASYNAIG